MMYPFFPFPPRTLELGLGPAPLSQGLEGPRTRQETRPKKETFPYTGHGRITDLFIIHPRRWRLQNKQASTKKKETKKREQRPEQTCIPHTHPLDGERTGLGFRKQVSRGLTSVSHSRVSHTPSLTLHGGGFGSTSRDFLVAISHASSRNAVRVTSLPPIGHSSVIP